MRALLRRHLHRTVGGTASVVLSFSTISCADLDGDATQWAGTIGKENGIVTVRNPAGPLLQREAVPLRTLWSTSGDTADAASLWQRPRWVVFGGGEVYVLDAMARRIHVISAEGQPVRTLGGEGGGPGELMRPFGIAVAHGLIAVGDGGKGTVELLRPDGSHARSIPLGRVGFSLHGYSPSGLLVSSLGPEGSGWKVLDLRTGELRDQSVPRPPGESTVDDEHCRHVSAGEEEIFVLNCTIPAFRITDAGGRITREVRVARGSRELTSGELREMDQLVRRTVSEVGYPPAETDAMVRRMVDEHRIVRSMTAVRRDPISGVLILWQQDPDEIGAGDPQIHVFTAEGVYLAGIPLAHPWVDFTIRDSTIYALVEHSDTGLVVLEAYRLSVPATPPIAVATR